MARGTLRKSVASRPPVTAAPLEAPPAPVSAVPLNETPLEYMLRVMRDPHADDERRDAMAKAALPYLHARLSNVDGQVPNKEDGSISFTWQQPQE